MNEFGISIYAGDITDSSPLGRLILRAKDQAEAKSLLCIEERSQVWLWSAIAAVATVEPLGLWLVLR